MKLLSLLRKPALALFTRSARSSGGGNLPVQTAALPWRRNEAGKIEIMLVASRSSGRWLIPKGWPMWGKSLSEAAAIEAFEEAGVEGTIQDRAIGEFRHRKNHRTLGQLNVLVKVHPLKVRNTLEDWPEKLQRKRGWFERDQALEAVASLELREILRSFRPS